VSGRLSASITPYGSEFACSAPTVRIVGMPYKRTAIALSLVSIAGAAWFIFSGDTHRQYIDSNTGRLVGELKPAEPTKTPSDREEGLQIALAQIDAEIQDPEARDILRQHAIGTIKGYGQSQPMDLSHPQAKSVAEALRTGTHPERLSPLIPARKFDRAAFLANPDDYLSVAEPGRVFQAAPAGAGVPALVALTPRRVNVDQGSAVTLSVQAEAGMPVTFTSFDGGLFGNGFVSQTVLASADGKVSVSFRGVEGTIANSQVLASSPTCSGQARFTVFTRVPEKK
jgi:hypothetical protein